jgi:tRNA A37 N6-isopentenylltransferase MiaA
MERVNVNVYDFKELSKEAKETAKKSVEVDLSLMEREDINEEIAETLKEEGLSGLVDDIRWTLGYGQDDGISFFGGVDLNEFIQAQKIETENKIPDFADVRIYSTSRQYTHFNTMEIDDDLDRIDIEEVDDFDNYEITEETYNETKAIIEKVLDKCKELSKKLEGVCYKIIENIESEAYIQNYMEINKMKFLKNGSVYQADAE